MADAKKFAMVLSEGSLDKAMMPLIMGTTAASMGSEVYIFCTFGGLDILKKNANPKLSGMMMPFTGMMKAKMKQAKVASFKELMQLAKELGIHFYACKTTMDIMGIKKEDLIEGAEIVGAATFLNVALGANLSLFIG